MSREKILKIIRDKGPVIPSQISKEIGTNILFASAMLSELVARRELKVSHLKIGGSPLYYVPGQETLLENFSDKLNEKEKAAYSLIKNKRLLKDKEEPPLNRVALRAIKDFAIPLEVSFNDHKEIFWKWYSLDNKEAETYIKGALHSENQTEILEQKQVLTSFQDTSKEDSPTKEKFPNHVKFGQDVKDTKIKFKKEKTQKAEHETLLREEEEKDNFSIKLEAFFKSSKFNIKEFGKTKKSEYEGTLDINTAIGTITFFYIAKNKKTITEKDIGEALAKGQLKNLQVIILSSGDISKKANQMLEKFKTIYYKKIEA